MSNAADTRNGDSDQAVLTRRRHAWLTLSLTAGLGPITTRRAVEASFGVLGTLRRSASDWAEVEGIGAHRAKDIVRDLPRALREADTVLATCDRQNIHLLTPEDDTYPALFRDLPDAPPVLYVRGSLEPRDLSALAMVGSRNCSFYGRDQASRFASLLAGAGITVVSGGARGVDSSAHEGALRTPQGRTLAVLGCGVDVVYPPENDKLFDQIATSGQGALLSHYPPGTPPNARHFPERNRVISALSRGVLVIEADERSGSLITARYAADDHNRPVMALPGRVDNPLSAGPHKLIRDGATLVTCLDDILESLGPLPESAHRARKHPPLQSSPPTPTTPRTSGLQPELPFTPPRARSKPTPKAESPPDRPPHNPHDATLSPDQKRILTALEGHHSAPAELLIEQTALPASVVLRELTLLTLKGRIRRVDAQTFELANKHS